MNLQAKIFVPVISSLIILGGSMYLLNREILKESYDSEIQKVLLDKQNVFEYSYKDKLTNLLQYSNILANSYAIRASYQKYQKTNSVDTAWKIINKEIDQIKYGALLSKQKTLNVNAYYKDGKVLFRSRSDSRGDNILQKRKTLQTAIQKQVVVKGIEEDKYGLDIRAITPVVIKNNFLGCIEVSYPLTSLLKNIRTEDYESYAIVLEKESKSKVALSEIIKKTSNDIDGNTLIGTSGSFNTKYIMILALYFVFL